MEGDRGGRAVLALIEDFFAALGRNDIPAMLECLSDGVIHDVNQGARRIGKPLFEAHCRRVLTCYRQTLSDLVIMVHPDGSRAAAEYTVSGSYVATDEGFPPAAGQDYTLAVGAFFEIGPGGITRITSHYNLRDWIALILVEGKDQKNGSEF
ncbi:nuclear transport factor 2 family protein [Nisaea acidiphila]|uniref:Nuclear transport factor 2 family protein n=1 Tax=Nisaea acidiphila TaxID=1862145 RepID=A0A9J7AUM0_9PROT|nr:nuclear transport factor 2 family protein [Nisaea acidiphila]UUX49101.1 nuclear transport factor 2 family protein [Nisaea acidiphila]